MAAEGQVRGGQQDEVGEQARRSRRELPPGCRPGKGKAGIRKQEIEQHCSIGTGHAQRDDPARMPFRMMFPVFRVLAGMPSRAQPDRDAQRGMGGKDARDDLWVRHGSLPVEGDRRKNESRPPGPGCLAGNWLGRVLI